MVNKIAEDYILWDSLMEEPMKRPNGLYNYGTLEELFNSFEYGKIPPYTEPVKIKNVKQLHQNRTADAIQMKKFKDALDKYFNK